MSDDPRERRLENPTYAPPKKKAPFKIVDNAGKNRVEIDLSASGIDFLDEDLSDLYVESLKDTTGLKVKIYRRSYGDYIKVVIDYSEWDR